MKTRKKVTRAIGNESSQPVVVQMFAISFDTEKQSLSFIGNISAEQAGGLIRLIIQQQQEYVMREKIKSELAQADKAKGKTQVQAGKEKVE